MDTKDLRKTSTAVYLATDEVVAKDLSDKLKWAADEIDKLRKQVASQSGVEADAESWDDLEEQFSPYEWIPGGIDK